MFLSNGSLEIAFWKLTLRVCPKKIDRTWTSVFNQTSSQLPAGFKQTSCISTFTLPTPTSLFFVLGEYVRLKENRQLKCYRDYSFDLSTTPIWLTSFLFLIGLCDQTQQVCPSLNDSGFESFFSKSGVIHKCEEKFDLVCYEYYDAGGMGQHMSKFSHFFGHAPF